MAFTVVADIEESKMEKAAVRLAEKYFGKNGSGDREESDSGKACGIYMAPAAEPFDKTINKRSHQANCVIGGLAPSLYQERERLAAVLLCNILGGPASNSMLNSVLREKNGWVYGVECSYTQYADTGIAAICLGCDRDNLDKCLKAIGKVLDKLRSGTLSERKLKAAKKQLLGQLAISSDNGETQCLSMGKGLLSYGKITGPQQTLRMVEAITAEDVREMACEIFSPDKLSRLIYL